MQADHGYPFATNFNPEINIREVSAKGSLLGGRTLGRDRADGDQACIQFPGDRGEGYVSAPPRRNRITGAQYSGIKRIRFFMTFGESYLTHLRCPGRCGDDIDRADHV